MEKITNVIKSPIAPRDNHALWLNAENDKINIFDFVEGVWVPVEGKDIVIDPQPTSGSKNPVASGGVYTALGTKADFSALSAKLDVATELTWSQLITLRDNNSLVPGQQYRIIDYVTIPGLQNVATAGHPFDLIVVADTINKLNENARAALHTGDLYFASSALESWELKYCLDNDTGRFNWANNKDGKGVIYYMKDEWGNECPYDFKNIMFNIGHVSEVGADENKVYYTFSFLNNSDIFDYSNSGHGTLICYNNKIGSYNISKALIGLPFNVFINTQNTGCYNNIIGSDCIHNYFGDGCHDNVFANTCHHNILCDNCSYNNYSLKCSYINIGQECTFNSFGENVEHINFGASGHLARHFRYIIIETGNSYIDLRCDANPTSSSQYQNIKIAQGVNNTGILMPILDPNVGQQFQTLFQSVNSRAVPLQPAQ